MRAEIPRLGSISSEPCIIPHVLIFPGQGAKADKENQMFGRIFTVAALAVGGAILSKQMKKSGNRAGMSTVEESIEVDVPISTAYNQWTQFEDFPQFMSSVQEVRQLDDTRLRWKATVAGKEKQWDAEITHQIPDKKIAWRSTTGVQNAGAVTFDRISDTRTRITLTMSYAPETFTEQVGDTLGAVKLQAKQNLSRFKEMLESRGRETGAWRGTVQPHH
jgi:uncharacterized membrane protein